MKKLFLILYLTVFCCKANADVLLETGFEGSTSLPAGWTQVQISGGLSWAITQGSGVNRPDHAHSGTHNASLYINSRQDHETRLISPIFDTEGYVHLSLNFWHTQPAWESDQDELKVLYSNDGGSTWTELAHYTDSVPGWTERTLELPDTSANSCIAFEGNAKYGYGVCLDDILVTGILESFIELSVEATDAAASEIGPDSGTWTISRIGNTTQPLAVNYTLNGTATEGSDYQVDTPSPLQFAAGQTSIVVTMTPVDDTVSSESGEVATFTLVEDPGYTISEANADIFIFDDDNDLNILVIGSTHSFSEGGEHDVVHEKPFAPTAVASHLQGILSQDSVLDTTVQVFFEDIFKTKTHTVKTSKYGTNEITAHCYSLAQHFFWLDGKAERLANLRGEAGVEWDYIILCSDPYIMANFPGIYAEGVKLIQTEVARSANPAQVVLLAHWPENNSNFTEDQFNEIVHRVGASPALTVVPAGKVWDAYSSQDTASAHPTPRGAYLAAASIYSKLYGHSANTSDYTFASNGSEIADHALSQVQAIDGMSQFSGTYTEINPFQMKYVHKREIHYLETGSSTERELRYALGRLDDVLRVRLTIEPDSNGGSNHWDFNFGRGNDSWDPPKQYDVNTTKYDRAYGFPMHHYYRDDAPYTMPYGIDKYYFGDSYNDGTDLGIAYNMIRPNTRELSLPEDVRSIPIRLLWLKMEQAYPGFNPLGDSTHMGPHLNDASAAFMYTLLSGRCPLVEEPASRGSTEWLQWLGHKTGYETAWQMSHLTTRTPGFQVKPSHAYKTTVTATTPEIMTVRFVNPPESDVTVSISVSNDAVATLSTNTLNFNASNYNIPQEVMVTGIVSDTGLQEFDVMFTTSSEDEIYDGLSDAWSYVSNTQRVRYNETVLLAGFDGRNAFDEPVSNYSGVYKELYYPHQSATAAGKVRATLSTTDKVEVDKKVGNLQLKSSNTSPSTWGSATFIPAASTTNHWVTLVNNEVTFLFFIENTSSQDFTLETLHFHVLRHDPSGGSADQIEVDLFAGDLTASGPGIQPLANSSGGYSFDFDLSTILSDATLSAGESATFRLRAVPTDPAGHNRRIRFDNIALSGYANMAGNSFATWISNYELGEATAFADDPDRDGLVNGIENYFGTNPGDPTHSVSPTLVNTGPGIYTFSHPISENPATDVTVAYRWSKDLTNFYYSGESDPANTVVTIEPGTPLDGVVDVTATITGAEADRIFFDMEIAQD